jgi:hypothetical protein
MPSALKKICSKCGKKKLLDDFYHNRTKPDFHNGICKECQIAVNEKTVRSES